jgi:ATP-dependent protease Clp ATPase subunit
MNSTLACSFCDRPQSDRLLLVAGPRIFICDSCVVHALATILSSSNGAVALERDAKCYCSFCGKESKDVSAVATRGKAIICDECITLTIEVVLEKYPRGRIVDLPPWTVGASAAE